ncbi:MAG: sigma-70 family RNA polymerase sigma factor [Deltaproteobacteria bacterium]|nr:sigma-70 family RNA polymerase sigma factor [Deltaproteobacteria bacterium]
MSVPKENCEDTVEPAIALLAAGDRKGAMTLLVASHGRAVYAFCARMLRDRVLAEDVSQQVFLEACRDLDRFQGRSAMRTWLLSIASHRCRDAMKATRRRNERIEADDQAVASAPGTDAPPIERLDRARLHAALERCLEHLSLEARAAVLLRFRSEMSYEEMAAALGAKADTLQARVARALPMLRRCFESKGWNGA